MKIISYADVVDYIVFQSESYQAYELTCGAGNLIRILDHFNHLNREIKRIEVQGKRPENSIEKDKAGLESRGYTNTSQDPELWHIDELYSLKKQLKRLKISHQSQEKELNGLRFLLGENRIKLKSLSDRHNNEQRDIEQLWEQRLSTYIQPQFTILKQLSKVCEIFPIWEKTRKDKSQEKEEF